MSIDTFRLFPVRVVTADNQRPSLAGSYIFLPHMSTFITSINLITGIHLFLLPGRSVFKPLELNRYCTFGVFTMSQLCGFETYSKLVPPTPAPSQPDFYFLTSIRPDPISSFSLLLK